MSENMLDPEDQRLLNLSQHIREKIITDLVADNKIPEDRDSIEILLKTMTDMDRSVFAKTKLRNDDKNAKQQAATSAIIAQALMRSKTAAQKKALADERELPSDYEIELVPGETLIGVEPVEYKTIFKDE